ncbi:MAG TPA: hypothetical protein VK983_01775 [Candidatus Limnocylindrales bacterium]|nr:hypothetical protein [Candidatus Limnocylindrales bacterium]
MPEPLSHQPLIDGYTELAAIQASMLAAIQHDLESDPRYVKTLIRELTLANPPLAITILSAARKQSNGNAALETAYLKGATVLLAALVRRERARNLSTTLAPQPPAEADRLKCTSCPI